MASTAATRSPLELPARQAKVVQAAIEHWASNHSRLISPELAAQLLDSVHVQGFPWDTFAKYTLRLAVLCLVIAVFSTLIALAAVELLEALEKAFAAHTRKTPSGGSNRYDDLKSPPPYEETPKAREMVYKRQEQLEERAINLVIFLLASIYGLVALLTGSNFIWSCFMVVISYWFEAMTCYICGGYLLFMKSPGRFVGLGVATIGASYLMREHPATAVLWATTRIWGLLFLFVALWVLSLDVEMSFFSTRHGGHLRHFLCFCVFFLAAGASVWHGLRYDDATTKGFGLAFLGINLYTKFWELCWGWYKPLFFAVLAGTFAMVGKFAEELWHMRALARLAA